MPEITHIFFDVGGVVLTNGWDHINREKAAEFFGYDYEESEAIHQKFANDFGTAGLTLDEYLEKILFYKKRKFTKESFVEFMKSCSNAYKTTFDVLDKLIQQNNYYLSTLNDESLELNEFRIEKFHLNKYFRNFFTSCYLGVKKPHQQIFQKVLGITQLNPENCLFIDDREKNAEAAQNCGFQVIYLEKIYKLEDELRNRGILK
ncbi:MAG: HAD family hydrolase [Aridibacter sp.]